MKIRIKGNSIRLRLSRTEVDTFAANGYIEEQTSFGTTTFIYRIETTTDHRQMYATYHENTIAVHVPESIAKRWTTTDEVGFQNKMDIGNNEQLFILVEKDFVCLDNTFEDQSDNYPNPNAAC